MGGEDRMEVKVCQIEGVKFDIETRSHHIACDQPPENGGTDCGMTPPEFLLASLGSCAAFYAAEYLRTRNLAKSGLEVSVTTEKLLKPRGWATSCLVTSPVGSPPSKAKE